MSYISGNEKVDKSLSSIKDPLQISSLSLEGKYLTAIVI